MEIKSNVLDDSEINVLGSGSKHDLKEEISDPVEMFPKAKQAIEYFETLKSTEIKN